MVIPEENVQVVASLAILGPSSPSNVVPPSPSATPSAVVVPTEGGRPIPVFKVEVQSISTVDLMSAFLHDEEVLHAVACIEDAGT